MKLKIKLLSLFASAAILLSACSAPPENSSAGDSSLNTSSEITSSVSAESSEDISDSGDASEASETPDSSLTEDGSASEESPVSSSPESSPESADESVSSTASSSTSAAPAAVTSSSSAAATAPSTTATKATTTAKPTVTTTATTTKVTTTAKPVTTKTTTKATTKTTTTKATTTAPSPATPTIPELSLEQLALPKSEALEFVKELKLGWNLGNTFDASDCTWLSNELDYESAWCGAKTTKQLIRSLKAAGFNSIRIPVSWHNHLSDKSKYTISKAWLDRVNEVVDWCIDEGMYVIINIHHDNSTEFMYPQSQYLDQSIAYVTAIWTQLSERFKNYDKHLIFESLNEPRLVGHRNEWWIDNNSADCKNAIECINKLNQAFVDTVRASGGNNATRYLTCPGYAASPEGALNSGFVLPTDPVKSNDHRIMITVHAYTPYNFALDYPGTSKWSSTSAGDVRNLVGFMDDLYKKYVSKGTPVIIDEFGARDKNGNLSCRVDFAAYYVAAARARGMSCFWWDNNSFSGSGENFGLIDRKANSFKYPEIVNAMVKYA